LKHALEYELQHCECVVARIFKVFSTLLPTIFDSYILMNINKTIFCCLCRDFNTFRQTLVSHWKTSNVPGRTSKSNRNIAMIGTRRQRTTLVRLGGKL